MVLLLKEGGVGIMMKEEFIKYKLGWEEILCQLFSVQAQINNHSMQKLGRGTWMSV